MRPFLRLAAFALVLLAVIALLTRRAGGRGADRSAAPTARPIRVLPPDSTLSGVVTEQHRVGRYLVRLLADSAEGDEIADVSQDGRRLFAVRATDVRLELIGQDVTGDKVPDVVVQQFSGGMHCCTHASVLSLGGEFRVAGTVDGADGDIEFDDVDGDQLPEVKVNDFRFAYWRDYAFVETQAPEVILRYRNGGYQPACDLMREDAPDQATLDRRTRELTDGWKDGDPPAEFWGYAVDLIYSGHAELAWSWLDRSWPASISGKSDFVRELREKLRGSPCWTPAERRPIS